jgi:hypothetical protein
MAKPYQNISIDEILNYDHSEMAVMSRFDRIMQHRTIEAMKGLSNRLDKVVDKLTG